MKLGIHGPLGERRGGGGVVQIRNQRPRKLPSTKFDPNQITFGIYYI